MAPKQPLQPLQPTPAPAAPAELQPWDQQPGEPDRWYGRFQLYLRLGVTRSFAAAYRAHIHRSGEKNLDATAGWLEWARRWHWRERAAAWDAWQRELLALSERSVSAGLRQRRVAVMEETLEEIRAALEQAEIAGADRETARAWLPQLRVFLRDLLVAERQEFEHAAAGPEPGLQITADDLRAAQRSLQAGQPWQEGLSTPITARPPDHTRPNRNFLVCTGASSGLLLDLAALRAVRSATGLQFERLIAPTQRKLEESLRRQRSLGRPIEYIHMSLHTSAAGIELADGPVDAEWLSERLGGVRVLLLASCTGDGLGAWLGVVPYVITLGEDIAHEDAATLTQQFWFGIGRGEDPPAALDAALAHCPPAVAEYVVRHW